MSQRTLVPALNYFTEPLPDGDSARCSKAAAGNQTCDSLRWAVVSTALGDVFVGFIQTTGNDVDFKNRKQKQPEGAARVEIVVFLLNRQNIK